jgi:ABC-2 type transport system ATP-binding protein
MNEHSPGREPAAQSNTNEGVTAAVSARGLTKTYPASGKTPAVQALKSVDLTIPVGSFFGLLGPNGAGKSTFINILAGPVKKTHGSVAVWGHDIDSETRAVRQPSTWSPKS